VIRSFHLWSSNSRLARLAWRDDRASQLVEFAVALPLLVVFVVGIFDFSGAFTLKQKLTNAARDGARVAAADPSNDLKGFSTPVPASVIDSFLAVYNDLQANNVNVCGMLPSNGTAPTLNAGLTWTYQGTTNCPSPGLTIIINRGYYFPVTGAALPTASCLSQPAGAQTAVISTCVSIQYAYQWRFGRAASLIGGSTLLPSTIAVVSVAMNEN
jgi:hypothetical protein